ACGIAGLLKGGFSENVSTTVDVHSLRQPLGVSAIISPFNFPAMVPMWFFPVAIAAGNTVVLKPSEYTPLSVQALVAVVNEVLPADVLTVVPGDGKVGAALTDHDGVDKAMFTGSTATGQSIMRGAA
ncbi:methylmalonate-semialdehyde dehydrogenase (CoA acylating), partial [Burkholderia multivorans]